MPNDTLDKEYKLSTSRLYHFMTEFKIAGACHFLLSMSEAEL